MTGSSSYKEFTTTRAIFKSLKFYDKYQHPRDSDIWPLHVSLNF